MEKNCTSCDRTECPMGCHHGNMSHYANIEMLQMEIYDKAMIIENLEIYRNMKNEEILSLQQQVKEYASIVKLVAAGFYGVEGKARQVLEKYKESV